MRTQVSHLRLRPKPNAPIDAESFAISPVLLEVALADKCPLMQGERNHFLQSRTAQSPSCTGTNRPMHVRLERLLEQNPEMYLA